MKGITKFLLIIAGILLAVYIFMKIYIKDNENISNLIGNKIGGGELSMSNYYSIVQCIETYRDYLIHNDYENAYKMLNYTYREYVPLEQFQEMVSKVDYSQMHITDIDAITASTFHVLSDVSGEEFSIVLSPLNNSFLLFPYTFLDYQTADLTTNQENMECTLKSYIVNTDCCNFNYEIENHGNQEMTIHSGMLYTTANDKTQKTMNVTIGPKETKAITVSFDTDYTFPKKVELHCSNGSKTDLDYIFEIKEYSK